MRVRLGSNRDRGPALSLRDAPAGVRPAAEAAPRAAARDLPRRSRPRAGDVDRQPRRELPQVVVRAAGDARPPRAGRRAHGAVGAVRAVRRDGPRPALWRASAAGLRRRAAGAARARRAGPARARSGRHAPRDRHARGRPRRRPRRVRALHRGRVPPRRVAGGHRRPGDGARAPRRRLHHARAPVLAPRGHELARAAVPERPLVRPAVPATGRRGTDRARDRGGQGDGARARAGRCRPHAHRRDRRDVRPARRHRPRASR